MDIKKIYYYIFYKIYKLFAFFSDDGVSDYKALTVIGVLQVFILSIISLQIEIYSMNPLPTDYPYLIPGIIGLILTAFNYYIFLHKNKWKAYEKEFKKLPKNKDILGGIAILLLAIGIFSMLIYSFYRISLINWR